MTPENRPKPKREVFFQPSIFRGELLVSGRVYFLGSKSCTLWWILEFIYAGKARERERERITASTTPLFHGWSTAKTNLCWFFPLSMDVGPLAFGNTKIRWDFQGHWDKTQVNLTTPETPMNRKKRSTPCLTEADKGLPCSFQWHLLICKYIPFVLDYRDLAPAMIVDSWIQCLANMNTDNSAVVMF